MCRFYSELLGAGLLQPLTAPVEGVRTQQGARDFTAPLGMSSLVKHFLSESGTQLHTCPHLSVPCAPVIGFCLCTRS